MYSDCNSQANHQQQHYQSMTGNFDSRFGGVGSGGGGGGGYSSQNYNVDSSTTSNSHVSAAALLSPPSSLSLSLSVGDTVEYDDSNADLWLWMDGLFEFNEHTFDSCFDF